MKISKIILISALSVSSAFTHGLWVNSFESLSSKGGHTMVGIGWGEHLSISDSVPEKMAFKSFDLVDPLKNKIALKKPLSKIEKIFENKNVIISDDNMALQKISFDKKSLMGTYSVALESKSGYFTKYIDKNNKNKFKRVSPEKIKDAKKIVFSTENINYAKTYFVFNKWTKPEPVGHNLEIIPTSDISKLKVGDTIELEVLYKGKPLERGYMTAENSIDKISNDLYSDIRKGKAKFVLTNSGQWLFNISHKKERKIDLVEKASATITIQ